MSIMLLPDLMGGEWFRDSEAKIQWIIAATFSTLIELLTT